MTTTSTLKQIIDETIDELDYGTSLSGLTGTTTTLTLTTTGSSDLRGPFTGKKIPIGSAVMVTAGGTTGEDTFVSDWAPSTGIITVSPAITTGATSVAILYADSQITHFDRLINCINRALNNRLTRWARCPLTFVPDGDLRGTTVTDYWTGTAATPTYVSPTFPAGSAAAAFGFTGFQRVLQSVTSNATNRVRSNLINVALNSTVTGYQWYFQTAIRVVSGSGNAQLLVWDETNDVQITVNVIAGAPDFTHTVTSLGFTNIEGTMNIPATCKQISFRLVSSATSTTIQMTPLVAFPTDATSFPIPNRIVAQSYIGNFHWATPVSASSGPYSLMFSEPITTGGLTHTINNFGDHFNVTFNFRPYRAIWFDELTYDPPLSAVTDTTSFPLDHVVKWVKAEIDLLLYEQETRKKRGENSAEKAQNLARYVRIANASVRRARNSEYEPELMHVVGRV